MKKGILASALISALGIATTDALADKVKCQNYITVLDKDGKPVKVGLIAKGKSDCGSKETKTSCQGMNPGPTLDKDGNVIPDPKNENWNHWILMEEKDCQASIGGHSLKPEETKTSSENKEESKKEDTKKDEPKKEEMKKEEPKKEEAKKEEPQKSEMKKDDSDKEKKEEIKKEDAPKKDDNDSDDKPTVKKEEASGIEPTMESGKNLEQEVKKILNEDNKTEEKA